MRHVTYECVISRMNESLSVFFSFLLHTCTQIHTPFFSFSNASNGQHSRDFAFHLLQLCSLSLFLSFFLSLLPTPYTPTHTLFLLFPCIKRIAIERLCNASVATSLSLSFSHALSFSFASNSALSPSLAPHTSTLAFSCSYLSNE